MKNCTRCGHIKEVGEFTTDRQKKDGLRNWCRTCVREHRQINLDHVKATKARHAAENRERLLQESREYHRVNRDSILERKRRYDAEHRDESAARMAEHYARRPEKRWVNTYQNRAKAYGFVPVVEEFTKRDVLDTYGGSCHYCPQGAFEELDHYIAVAAGGPHTLNNVRPSCARCNNRKSIADKVSAQNARTNQRT